MAFQVVYSDKKISHHIHTHLHYELIYVLEGAVMMSIRGKSYRAQTGTLIFLNQFDEHATRVLSDVYKRYYLLIPPAQFKGIQADERLLSVFRFHGEDFPYILSAQGNKQRFDAYFALLKEASDRGGPYTEERMNALMTLILTDALAICPGIFAPAQKLSFLPVREVLDELDRSFATGFSLKSLADAYHVSPGCLSAHFRRYVGMSPMQYVTQSRLLHARSLLLKTGLSVMEISSQCGYQDVSNFVRRFRSQFQMTPLQFRQKNTARGQKKAVTESKKARMPKKTAGLMRNISLPGNATTIMNAPIPPSRRHGDGKF